jgi:hypothetical protein
MRLSLPTQRLVPMVLLGVLAVVFLAIVAGKIGGNGGGKASGTDPQQIVEKAFSAQSFKSGKFDATAQVSFKGAPSPQLANVAMNLTGAFVNDPKHPKADLHMTVDAAGRPVDFGMISTGKAVYFTLGDTAYRVPSGSLNQTKSQPQDLSALGALGLHPQSWFVNPTNAGSASVGGVETDHVTAQLDTAKMVDDIARLASASGDASAPSQKELQDAKSAVKGGAVDLYVAKSDGSLRRISARAEFVAPDQSRVKLGNGTIAFDQQFTDINKPQNVTAPSNVRPLSEFETALNSRMVRALSGVGGSSGGGSAQSGSGGGSAASEAPAPTLPGNAQKYLDCVEKARTNADVQKCAPLLD